MLTLPETLQAIVRRAGESIALVEGDSRISYANLQARAIAIAQGLRTRGITDGDRVASAIGHTSDAVAVIYGAWLAGAVIVPLNALAPASEVASLLMHAGARALLHEPGYSELSAVVAATRTAGLGTWTVRELMAEVTRQDAESFRCPQISLESLAMLLYTSGTTGRPKGVMLSHGNMVANVRSIIRYLELSDRDSVMSVLPFNYSYGTSVLHTHLAVGGTVVLARNFVFPQVVVEAMAREKVTGFSGVPSTFALLLSRVNLADAGLESLRYVTQAGAAMSPSLKERICAALPQAKLFVMYGQTEATARLSYVPPDRLSEKPGSAGVAIPGVELAIRDEDGSTLGPNEIGEIWARGPNIMKGYWRDEAATREVLRDGWLKTGDMGYLDSDRFLFIVGRRSDIIKVGAHRVHPMEVEEVVSGMAGIREVAVAGVEDEMLGQTVAAFVVLEPGAELPAERIKAICRERLAPYKIPKYVRFVTTLPRTASGKLQRFEMSASHGEESV
jgi:acyl-CoA synthetase (AMP-forming)/AMP-acid ligase II